MGDYAIADYSRFDYRTPKDGSDFTSIRLINSKDGSDFVTLQLRSDGIKSYSFELRDTADTLIASDTGLPPNTVFNDLFTGIGDGDYILYVQSVDKYKSLVYTINETYVPFRLVSGFIQPYLPNPATIYPVLLRAEGYVRLEFSYISAGQEIAPDDFVVYAGGIAIGTVTYNANNYSYSVVVGPLAEVLTDFEIKSRVGVLEVDGNIEQATPDATPPNTVPTTFITR